MRLADNYEKNGDLIVTTLYDYARRIANQVTVVKDQGRDWDQLIDDLVTSKYFGYPLMFLLLGVVFWITIVGANCPSQLLSDLFFWFEGQLTFVFQLVQAPEWLYGLLVLGVYRGLSWVVSVMLPPMAIFFPLFTLLEDLGYLPRVAFNLDHLFKRSGAHGKMSLTMSMGFGCNAAGVIAARIIESPRERLIAILTNNFVPCNGRFPGLIAMSSMFMAVGISMASSSLVSALVVASIVITGIMITLAISWLLSRTLLKGESSSFTLELPPYRKPQVITVLIRSFFDRTIFVLWRAVKVAAPAGALIWFLANITVGEYSFIAYLADFLDPLGRIMGLDGVILLAFILGLPANEIVIPIMVMTYLSEGAMIELDSLSAFRQLLLDQGWTWLTALNFMLFSLLHFPCGTTLLTIKKETGSKKWTILAAVLPTIVGIIVCTVIAWIVG
ncbi:MAG: ferrous iron transporter B [Firmicutes bacterium]|nr:ferrous iron transporter B [Bacillota bacterium]